MWQQKLKDDVMKTHVESVNNAESRHAISISFIMILFQYVFISKNFYIKLLMVYCGLVCTFLKVYFTDMHCSFYLNTFSESTGSLNEKKLFHLLCS